MFEEDGAIDQSVYVSASESPEDKRDRQLQESQRERALSVSAVRVDKSSSKIDD